MRRSPVVPVVRKLAINTMADMTEEFDVNAALQVALKMLTEFKDGNNAFCCQLPEDGLALHSVGIVDGVPELRFRASPKVPTIQEEDIATVFRLVSEKKRPEFYYINFPPTHPMHQCRYLMCYTPAWLRWTAVGELLADADWKMKCLHVGTKANENKSAFKSWSEESQLDNLATHLDFPKDGPNTSIFMSCEYATVQKDNDEMIFPEEPKMRIADQHSSLYTKYITEIYPSVAYYDEPNFLKMQELIKLILAVEWLYKEKGIRVNQEWMMKHTSNAKPRPTPGTTKKPPYRMIPKPTVVKRPSSDVTANTREAGLYKTLKTKCQVERQYGYYDFASAQVNKFKEDGTPCPPQKCLKVCIDHHLTLHQCLGIHRKGWFYFPMETRDDFLKLLPKNSHEEKEIAPLVPVTVDTKVDEHGMEVKLTNSAQAFSQTIAMTLTLDNSDKHFANESPKMPIMFGPCEAIIPDVESWDELISELTVPVPHIWHAPFVGIGEPMATGGVTTSSFEVREEPLPKKVFQEETYLERKGNYRSNGFTLGVCAEQVRAQGTYVSITNSSYHIIIIFLIFFHRENSVSQWSISRIC